MWLIEFGVIVFFALFIISFVVFTLDSITTKDFHVEDWYDCCKEFRVYFMCFFLLGCATPAKFKQHMDKQVIVPKQKLIIDCVRLMKQYGVSDKRATEFCYKIHQEECDE